MTDELKPCPFCGFSPEIDEADFLYPLTRERDVWGAHCYETGGGCGLCVVGDSKEGALKAWNRRISASIADTDVIETRDGQNLMQVWFECGRDVFAFYDRIMGTSEGIADTARAKPVAKFDDPRVQTVYELICDGQEPPKGEHWDGFVARRIVDALFAAK